MQSNELKKSIIKLLKEDEDFRYTVAGLLGINRLDKIEEALVRLTDIQAKSEARLTKVEERLTLVEERLEKHDKKFNDILQEIAKLRQDTKNEFSKVWQVLQELKVSIGSIGRRIGKDLELTILNIYKDQLMQIGIDPAKARRFEYIDYEGKYGLKGKRYEFDIVISNTHADIIEVKSHAEEEDIVFFYEKVNNIKDVLMEKFNNIGRLIIVAVDIDEEALTEANRLGINTVYGCVIRD